jgi:hypothetical protein
VNAPHPAAALHDLLKRANRIDTLAVLVAIFAIVMSALAVLAAFGLGVVGMAADADCGSVCLGQVRPVIGAGLGVIFVVLAFSSLVLLGCSYVRLRARAIALQFTMLPPPFPPYPAPPPG